MKKIMILGASILQLPAIEKALEMGLEVVTVDMNPEAVGMKVPGVNSEIVSTIDIPAVISVAQKYSVDGVITLASDMPMRSVAAVAKELGLVGISDDTALKATNKAIMRQALKDAGVPIPIFFKVSNKDEYNEIVQTFKSSVIVKPADNSGSRGVFKVSDISDRKQVEQAYTYSKQFSRSGDIVVEEYMNGPEVSVETLTVDGECHVIQITDKLTTGAPHFVEMGHSQPTMLCKEISEKISQVAIAANKAIGINNGPSHTEIIVTKEGPKIVEIGARLGGDNITTHLVPLSTGVDMVKCCIKIALGERPDIDFKKKNGAAIRYLNQSAGHIVNIDGVDLAKNIDGVEQVNIIHNVGDVITDVENSTSRMGYVVAEGKDAVDAIKKCEDAINKISIDIKKDIEIE